MQDAYILGRLLAHKATALENVDAAMKAYQATRLEFGNHVVAIARSVGAMYEFTEGPLVGTEPPDKATLEAWKGALMDVWRFQWSGNIDKDWASAEKLLLEGIVAH